MATDNIEDQLNKDEFRDDIMRVEGDVPDAVVEQIATENQQSDAAAPDELTPEQPMIVTTKKPRRNFLKSKKFWAWFMGLTLFAGILIWLITPSRIWLVNLVGQRATLSIESLAEASPGQMPSTLKNATITLNGVKHVTNDRGKLTVQQPYGDVVMVVSKPGFKPVTKKFKLDFDPFFYKFGGQSADSALRNQIVILKSVGLPLTFKAVDWLTGQGITTGKFILGDLVAGSNDQGIVNITIPATDAKRVKLKAKFDGAYTDKEFEVTIQATPVQNIEFVPAGDHYFIKRDTGYGLYRSNLDGSNVTQVIAGTANDTAVTSVSVAPGAKYATLVSTREGTRSARGIIQPQLYLVDLAAKRLTTVETADWFKVAGWSGDTVVYVLASDGTQRLVSVDVITGKRTLLASGKTIGDVFVGHNGVRYTVTDPAEANSPQLFGVSLKGGTPVSLGNKVQKVAQPSTETIVYQTADNMWHEYNVNTGRSSDASPPVSTSRQFLNATSQNGQHRLFIDVIDGVPSLFMRNVAGGQDVQLIADDSLQGPIRWAGNTVVFRKVDATGAADYAISVRGGQAKKITNVTATAATELEFN